MLHRTMAAVAIGFLLSSAAAAADPTAPQVHVWGRGLVRVAPDQVVIELTVTTIDDDLIRVRASSDNDARAIFDAATKNGVAEEGFEVSRLDLTLDYNEQLRRQIYKVERDVTLRLNDLTKLDALLSDLLGNRSLQVSGISFVNTNIRQHEIEARRRAVADAREKATQLAELNGVKLGDAIDIRVIQETEMPFLTSIIPVVGAAEPQNRGKGQGESARVAQSGANRSDVRFVALQPTDDEAAPDAGEAFALGMIEVTAEVAIDFALAK
jgi:hypothetical protein